MNTLLLPDQTTAATELPTQAIGTEYQPLLTSQDLQRLDIAELARVAGLDAATDRDVLYDAARKVQLQRLGSFISSFALNPTDTVIEDIGTRHFREFDVAIDSIEESPQHARVLGKLITLDEMLEDELEEVFTDFVPDPIKITVSPTAEIGSEILAPLAVPIIEAEKPTMTLRELLRPQEIDPGLLPASNEITDKNVLKRMLGSINVLSDKSRQMVQETAERVGRYFNKPSTGRGLFLASAVYVGIALSLPVGNALNLNEVKRPADATADATADAPKPSGAQTEISVAPLPQTVETVPSTTVLQQEPVAIDFMPIVEIQEAPTTTIDAYADSLMKKVASGEIDLYDTATLKIAELDIPTLCLGGIDIYGANKGSHTDQSLLDALQAQGNLTDAERNLFASGQGSEQFKADIRGRFDRIYLLTKAEKPQEACEMPGSDNPAYPPRWARSLQGSTQALTLAQTGESVAAYEPIGDMDWQGVAPSSPGNVVLSGHRTTESAPFANIDRIQIGDTFTLKTDDGKVYTYQVEKTETVTPDEAGYQQILNYQSPTGVNRTATLYTCDQGGDVRYVVRAVLVSEA